MNNSKNLNGRGLFLADQAVEKLIADFKFRMVLDFSGGAGLHSGGSAGR